jgi:serine phosphatase RsbU (regulator of sigma subunit)
MKKLMVALLATSTMAFAVPALAHEHPDEAYAQAGDWNNGGDSYAAFDQEYRHIWQGIQHGVGDGSYAPWQAQRFYRAMQQIHARADWMERRGVYDPDDIQRRLERLHDDMHVAHERGHERLDERYGYGGRYGYDPR